MGVWDIATPLGSESKSLGDDRIREMKTALQEALRGQAASGVEAVFPGASPSSAPVYRYRGLKDTTANRPTAGDGGMFIDTDRKVIQRDNGASWEDIATLIPSGTIMVFYQAAAPSGWTQVVTQNDKALRVVSAAGGGSGGAAAISTGHSHTVNSHTHDLGNHTHTTPNHTHTLAVSSAIGNGITTIPVATTDASPAGDLLAQTTTAGTAMHRITATTSSGGSGTSGAPSSNTSGGTAPGTDTSIMAYVDVIICSKN